MSNINENKDNDFEPKQLNLAGFDLDKSSMIEASAGTGKTFTISNLVVLDERIHNPHEGVTALVKKTKTTVKVLNEEISKTVKVTYYISSIFDEGYTIRQVRACFQNCWRLRRTILY